MYYLYFACDPKQLQQVDITFVKNNAIRICQLGEYSRIYKIVLVYSASINIIERCSKLWEVLCFSLQQITSSNHHWYLRVLLLKRLWWNHSRSRPKASVWKINITRELQKIINYYMPNKWLGWNVEMQTEDPTRNVPVNQLIRDVKKKK